MPDRCMIAGVSYASLGYGSPQVLYLMASLRAHFDARAVVYEPHHPERPRPAGLEEQYGLTITRIRDRNPNPKWTVGRLDFAGQVARALNRERPECLVLFSSYTVPVLFKLDYRPRYVIYYALESEFNWLDRVLHAHMAAQVDLVLMPEENRAASFLRRFDYRAVPLAIVYNCRPGQEAAAPATARNGRVLYQGGIIERQTFAEYFWDARMQGLAIDLYGPIEGADKDNTRTRLHELSGNVRYCGYVPASELAALRRAYCYSLCAWAPDSENQRFAAPNKFFEAIADGIPPITAPHPQCKMLTERYGCGIVMEDWSFEAMHAAIQQGLAAVGTPAYEAMVAGCRRAVAQELNWEAQFTKIAGQLPDALGKDSSQQILKSGTSGEVVE